MSAFWLSFVVIFVAELGDKSQLMALAFATRYRFWTVVGGITAATLVLHLGSVALGGLVGGNLPTRAINVAAGVVFLGFGAWTVRGDSLTEADRKRAAQGGRSAFLTVAVAFFLAELGDKTMLATVTLATTEGWVGTWLGSTAGMVVADALVIAVGVRLGRALPERTVRVVAAALFVLFGVWLIRDGVVG